MIDIRIVAAVEMIPTLFGSDVQTIFTLVDEHEQPLGVSGATLAEAERKTRDMLMPYLNRMAYSYAKGEDMSKVTLVIAWGTDLEEVLGIRRAVNMRHAREVAALLEKEFPWSPRISFYEERDFNATEAGMTKDEIKRAVAGRNLRAK